MTGDPDRTTADEAAQLRFEDLLDQNRQLRSQLQSALAQKNRAEAAHKATLEKMAALTDKLQGGLQDNDAKVRRRKFRFF